MNGVLTNPNCEYSANYVAVHTLAQWSRLATELVKRPSPTRQAFQLEVEGRTNESSELDRAESTTSGASTDSKKADSMMSNLELHLYEPQQALEAALKEWIHEFWVSIRQTENYCPVKNATSIAKASEFDGLGKIDTENTCETDRDVNKRVDQEVDPKLESSGRAELVSAHPFSYEDLKVFVDFFYLPHQHGERSMRVLEEFCWIKENAPGMCVCMYVHVFMFICMYTHVRYASKKTFHTAEFNHRRYCMVQPLFDRCFTVARPSLNRSISAVGLVQTQYAPLHNYRVTVCRCSGVAYTWHRSIGTHTLKWFVYRPVAARVQIRARRRSSRSSANSARGRSVRASSGQWIIVELARAAPGPPVQHALF